MNALSRTTMQPFQWVESQTNETRCASIPTRPDYYPAPNNFQRELRRAYGIYQDLCTATGQMFGDVRVGRVLDSKILARPLTKMVASVIRNPEAMVWMRTLHPQLEPYLVGHSVRTAVLSVVVAREMGMVEPQLKRIGMGALLCQIGKTKMPMKLLEKAGPLPQEDLNRLRRHVKPAAEVLSGCGSLSPASREIVENHLERFNGSGLPNGKTGDQIPPLARIVGMVEWYDAMTSLKPYTQRVLNTTQSMDYLYQQRNILFQDQIVEEFVRALGIYPNGTLVELNTREVALVQAQNPGHRTQPQILLVQDANQRKLAKYENIDMADFNCRTDVALTIKRALTPGECELDVHRVMQHCCKSAWQRLVGSR